jgi:hypothetical protein
MASNEK